jgi:hypothetical protein
MFDSPDRSETRISLVQQQRVRNPSECGERLVRADA